MRSALWVDEKIRAAFSEPLGCSVAELFKDCRDWGSQGQKGATGVVRQLVQKVKARGQAEQTMLIRHRLHKISKVRP